MRMLKRILLVVAAVVLLAGNLHCQHVPAATAAPEWREMVLQTGEWAVRAPELTPKIRALPGGILPLSGGCLSQDGRRLATGYNLGALVWDLDKLALKVDYQDVDAPIFSGVGEIALSPDGKTLAVEQANNVYGGIQLIEAARSKLEGASFLSHGPCLEIRFSLDGKILRIRGGDRRYFVDSPDTEWWYWDVTGKVIETPDEGVRWADPLKAGGLRINRNEDGSISLYDEVGNLLATLRVIALYVDMGGANFQRLTFDWLWTTPDGHYFGSPGAEKLVTFRVNGEIKPASDFPKLRSREAVRAALRVK